MDHHPRPLSLKAGKRDLHVDLGAERNTLAAERAGVKIGVEIQSFAAESDVRSLQQATGQLLMYLRLMARQWPDHKLYLRCRSRCTPASCRSL